MKFVLAFYGTRGDVEPGVAVMAVSCCVADDDVRMAVSPDLVEFVETAGPTCHSVRASMCVIWQDLNRDFWARFLRKFWKNFWRVRDLAGLLREEWHLFDQYWQEVSKTLTRHWRMQGGSAVHRRDRRRRLRGNVAEACDVPMSPCCMSFPHTAQRPARSRATGAGWPAR